MPLNATIRIKPVSARAASTILSTDGEVITQLSPAM